VTEIEDASVESTTSHVVASFLGLALELRSLNNRATLLVVRVTIVLSVEDASVDVSSMLSVVVTAQRRTQVG
jgi:hypothetical protein